MEKQNTIQEKIDITIQSLETIEKVNVSPFFKDKTMQRLFSEKEETVSIWNWFTPQLQLATLICVVVLNIMAFSELNKNSYENNVSEFAETYGLGEDSELEIALFN